MALGSVFGLLQRWDVLTAIVVLIISPFLTYYLTTLVFYRRSRSKELGKYPPTIPFYLIGIFHTFSLMTAGPQQYFAQLLKDFGNFAPFMIRVGSRPYLILRDPKHIAIIYTTSKQFNSHTTQIDILEKLFGLPESAAKLYTDSSTEQATEDSSVHTNLTLPTEDIQVHALATLARIYVSILSRSLNDKMFQVNTWTQIEDVWSFFQQVLTRCTIETMFGSDMFKQYPKIVREYGKFSEAIEDFVPGMPGYMVTTAATTAREQLQQGMEKWLRSNHSGTDFARTRDEDPDWDAFKGSKYLQQRDSGLTKHQEMDIKGRTAYLLCLMHSATAGLVSSTIWTILEVSRRPQLRKELLGNMDRYCPSSVTDCDIAGIAENPLVQSIRTEVERLRTAPIAVRLGDSSQFKLSEQWSIPPNTAILTFPHDFSFNADAWEKARPGISKTPLEEFSADRFLVSEKIATKLNLKGTRDPSSSKMFSTDGLESLLIGTGEHPHNSLGPDYIKTMYAATLAVMFTEFEIQVDPEVFDAARPPIGEVAYGTIKPLGPVPIRIKKRGNVAK